MKLVVIIDGILGAGNPVNGTGGLIVCYANEFYGGTFIARGSSGGSYVSFGWNFCGGCSGGGSINLFAKVSCKIQSTDVDGGVSETGGKIGGTGGAGTVSIGTIVGGYYKDINI